MSFLAGEVVVLLRGTPGGTDAYGDPIPGTVTRTDVPGCAIDARYSTEPTERGRHGVAVGLTVFAPAGTDVRSGDQVEIRGLVYDVEGIAVAPVNPFTGWTPGVEFTATREVG